MPEEPIIDPSNLLETYADRVLVNVTKRGMCHLTFLINRPGGAKRAPVQSVVTSRVVIPGYIMLEMHQALSKIVGDLEKTGQVTRATLQ